MLPYGADTKQDEVAYSAQGKALWPCFASFALLTKAEAHKKNNSPPQKYKYQRRLRIKRGRCQEDEHEPPRLQLFKTVVQCEEQNGKSEDQTEPVRLCQHSAHSQERIGQHPGKADDKIPELILDLQNLPDFDRETSQHQHKAGEHTENLRKA